MRKKGENPLILDAGDMFFSKTNISNNIKSEKFRCSTMLQGYEKIGCDALNIGKYELLAGVSFLKQMEEKYKNIPFVSANIKYKDTGELLFRPYIIEERDGLKIGVIGLSNMVPDTMTNIVADDYIKTGNTFIKNLKNQVDLIVLLVNTDRNSQSSLTKNFDEADFIFTSGSTHRTSASMPQKPDGPYVYANGKQGKYLTLIDLDIKNNKDPISDLSSKEQKIRQLTNRLKRLQNKDPFLNMMQQMAENQKGLNQKERDLSLGQMSESAKKQMLQSMLQGQKDIQKSLQQLIEEVKQSGSNQGQSDLIGISNDISDVISDISKSTYNRNTKSKQRRILSRMLDSRTSLAQKLEDLYSDQEAILNLIKRYRSELKSAKTLVEKSKNKMRFSSLALNKKIKDDPEILAMVDVALNKFKLLDVDKNSTSVDKHHNHDHSRSLKKKDSRKSKKIKSKL